MDIRYSVGPGEVKHMDTAGLRAAFLIDDLFIKDQIKFTYSHYDRLIIGGAMPGSGSLILNSHPALKAEYFLERRELGVINVGDPGFITIDEKEFYLEKLDAIYISKGSKNVSFKSDNKANAIFYILSANAHAIHETKIRTKADAEPLALGTAETANKRTVYKYIFSGGLQSCQLVMGLTVLEPGSVWNTMPPHVHDRRMEAYLYFDLPSDQRVCHLMGLQDETRHLWLANLQSVISPPWSIHSGCGTSAYSFVWGMAGENKDYSDMDLLKISQIL